MAKLAHSHRAKCEMRSEGETLTSGPTVPEVRVTGVSWSPSQQSQGPRMNCQTKFHLNAVFRKQQFKCSDTVSNHAIHAHLGFQF